MPSRGWLPALFCSNEWSPCCGLDHPTILPITISSTIPNLGILQSKLLILHDPDGTIPSFLPPNQSILNVMADVRVTRERKNWSG